MADLILEIVEGEDAGRQTPVGGAIEIGREADLSLRDEQTSRHHARVSAQGDLAVVEDLGSTNGTYVNDQPIEGPRAVRPGDKIRIGLTVLELRTAQEVQQKPSAVMPVPQVTRVSQEVLEPVPEAELEPDPAEAAPAFAVEESTPGFVPQDVADDPEARSDYAAVARLVDARVKRQTRLASFTLLAAAGLAVVLVFGLK